MQTLATLTALAQSAATLLGQTPPKSYKDKATAQARLDRSLEALAAAGTPHEIVDGQLQPIKAEVIEIAPERKKRRAGIQTSRAGFKDAQFIRLVRRDNPKRKGSPAAARYSFYRDAMTVKQFSAIVGRRAALSDLAYDVAQGFIRIENVLDEGVDQAVAA